MGWRYAALEERFARIGRIQQALAILHWDNAVVMPPAASAGRGEQVATLQRIAHDLLTGDETGEHLAEAELEAGLDDWQSANLREMGHRYRRARPLEPALVEAMARARTACEMVWRGARRASDFPAVLPHLHEVVELTRRRAAALAAALELDPYDALLDTYQPGLRDASVELLFGELAAELPGLIGAAERRPRGHDPAGPFPIERQKVLARELMVQLGFDFAGGRLDESAHPFCGGNPDDVRITTRYEEGEVASALMAPRRATTPPRCRPAST